jgi:NADPH-dependent curcumin reductase CurA
MRGWITAKRSYMPAVMPGEMVSAASGAVGSIAAQSASMQGFTMHHFTDRAPEAFMALLGWKMKGQLKFREHVLRGIESFLATCDMIFSGANQGKLLIDLEGMPS